MAKSYMKLCPQNASYLEVGTIVKTPFGSTGIVVGYDVIDADECHYENPKLPIELGKMIIKVLHRVRLYSPMKHSCYYAYFRFEELRVMEA